MNGPKSAKKKIDDDDKEGSKSLFHSLLKNDRSVIEKKELDALSLIQLMQLIEEISQEIIARPDFTVDSFTAKRFFFSFLTQSICS